MKNIDDKPDINPKTVERTTILSNYIFKIPRVHEVFQLTKLYNFPVTWHKYIRASTAKILFSTVLCKHCHYTEQKSNYRKERKKNGDIVERIRRQTLKKKLIEGGTENWKSKLTRPTALTNLSPTNEQ